MTSIDSWFLYQLKEINDIWNDVARYPIDAPKENFGRRSARESDQRLAGIWGVDGREAGTKVVIFEGARREARLPACGHVRGGFESCTPYLYSTSRKKRGGADQDKGHRPGPRAESHRTGN